MDKKIKIDRVGEIHYNNQGLKMWIREYRSNKDIDVEFEDGFISYNKKYIDFKRGKIHDSNFKRAFTVKSPILNDRTGEEKINNQNLKMYIENYRNCKDIDIRFEDGYLARNKTYKDFKKGLIHNVNFKYPPRPIGFKSPKTIKTKMGETNVNRYGSIMTIIKYNNFKDIVVEFENKYQKHTNYKQFKAGRVSNPYDRTFYGVGYLGEGKYKTSIDKKHTLEYDRWKGMLSRCYNLREKAVNKSYDGVTVCEEWLCFQTFAEWYAENYYTVDGERMHLDKDILCKGNKIYNPNTCCIVPERINILFVKNKNKRGKYPIGVHYDKREDIFIAGYNLLKESIIVGYYDNPIDAFYKGYKPAKEKLIKQVAVQYKDKIPKKLYDAMYAYKVEITD